MRPDTTPSDDVDRALHDWQPLHTVGRVATHRCTRCGQRLNLWTAARAMIGRDHCPGRDWVRIRRQAIRVRGIG